MSEAQESTGARREYSPPQTTSGFLTMAQVYDIRCRLEAKLRQVSQEYSDACYRVKCLETQIADVQQNLQRITDLHKGLSCVGEFEVGGMRISPEVKMVLDDDGLPLTIGGPRPE
jgi:hypothetical protein